jgi:protein TonB
MAQAILERPRASRPAPASPVGSLPTVRFESLVLTEPASLRKGRTATLTVSLIVHGALVAALVLIPIFYDDVLPAPDAAVFRTFFVTPAAVAPPPPPPPPPPAGVRAQPRTPVAPRPAEEPARFVAPIEVPTEIKPEEGLDLGVEGGVPGGVEGGVPGGVVGGVVGGLPTEAATPVKAVRIGGKMKAPALLHRVNPEYPELALAARVTALLILEATVGEDGQVRDVTVLRGQPLFDPAAVAAVKQWRYRPLLLNGVPTPFILTVTLKFSIEGRTPVQ